jgi:DNA-binding MarR family transcriptional regulator
MMTFVREGQLRIASLRCRAQHVCCLDLTIHAYACNLAYMKIQSLPCYCATLRQAARAVTALYEEVLAEGGVHATQYTALQVLESVPKLTTTELAEMIGIDQTTATRTLALIKKNGLAVDAPGNDRRQRWWTLTPQGRAQVRKLKPTWEAAQEEFENRLGRTEAAALKKAAYLAASKLAPR